MFLVGGVADSQHDVVFRKSDLASQVFPVSICHLSTQKHTLIASVSLKTKRLVGTLMQVLLPLFHHRLHIFLGASTCTVSFKNLQEILHPFGPVCFSHRHSRSLEHALLAHCSCLYFIHYSYDPGPEIDMPRTPPFAFQKPHKELLQPQPKPELALTPGETSSSEPSSLDLVTHQETP